MYGRHGINAQLGDLRNNKEVRDALVYYLGIRAPGTGWQADGAVFVYLRVNEGIITA